MVLILAWLTPALLAGALGWTGIWGTGSAFSDYLVPIPVAGGAMHVPSFVVLAILVMTMRRNEIAHSYLPWLAFAAALAALATMLDFDRLNGWLFTDYAPHGSPLRLDGNPLLLFIFTDACWAGIYALSMGKRPPLLSWLALPAAPLAVIAASALTYTVGGPVFEIGTAQPGPQRGEQIRYVYASEPYDETEFLRWHEQNALSKPWENPNVEHQSIVFTNSLQLLKWHWQEDADEMRKHIVATLCLYEEDRTIVPHRGSFDCFAQRKTFTETFEALQAANDTGLGREVDAWYALLLLCDDVEIPAKPSQDIIRESRCAGLRGTFDKTLQIISVQHGPDSAQALFVLAQARARGLVGASS